MKYSLLVAFACCAALTACGGKVDEMKKSIEQVEQLAKAGEKMEEAASEAQKFYDERKAKGDTVAMPYKDLQAFLPTAVSGFKAEGEPSGSQQSMQGYSMSTAAQNWVSEAADGGRVMVTVNDWGGTEGAYGLASLAFAMGFSSEDDNQKTESIKPDVPHTSGLYVYQKKTHDVTVTMGTRYRYIITVNLTGAKDDQSQAMVALATEVAKKFDGK